MEIITKNQFEKDIKRLKKQGKNFSKLEAIIKCLITQEPIDKMNKNHPLIGKWKPCWELHIEPDWLLIYTIDKNNKQLILHRTGSHSELF